jgi:hypothetical protein
MKAVKTTTERPVLLTSNFRSMSVRAVRADGRYLGRRFEIPGYVLLVASRQLRKWLPS